jgi:hypothetical protein
MRVETLPILVVVLLAICGSAQAQNLAPEPASAESEEDHLAKEVEDPTAILAQLQFVDLYTPRNFQSSAQTNTLQLKPIVPIRAFAWFPFAQLIRPTFKFSEIATSARSSTITEFQDMELVDLFVSNWPNPKETGFGWGIGPTFVFPTGRVSPAGNHAWEAGPAAAVGYRGIPHLTIGFLFQNFISVGYTNSSAKPQSQMLFQPRISYTLGHGWYVKSSDSSWTVNWRHGGSTTIPVSLGIGKVWKFEGVQLNPFVTGEWTTYRQNTKITPMYTVRFGLTILFPNLEI